MAIGIVCEFNPFHNGHEYILKKARQIDPSGVVCAMSGGFVQRGEMSFADKYERARWATLCGADVVIENPYPFSMSSAEIFAKSAVRLLFGTGLCSSLCFGAETDRGEMFVELARFLSEKNTVDGIRSRVSDSENRGFAVARSEYVRERLGEVYSHFLSLPNNILGVEYVRAMMYYGIPVDIHPIKRIFAEHDGAPQEHIASASYLRQNPTTENLSKYCPDCVKVKTPRVIDRDCFTKALQARILLYDRSELCDIAEMTDDLAVRLAERARDGGDAESFFDSLRARHITDAKLRRLLIFAFLGTKKSELSKEPLYANLLSCTHVGAGLIKSARNISDIPILSKISESKKLSPEAKEQFDRAQLAERVIGIFRE